VSLRTEQWEGDPAAAVGDSNSVLEKSRDQRAGLWSPRLSHT